MKIKLSKSQWEEIGKKTGWIKVSMLTHLLEEIKMQGDQGLNIPSMSYEELQDAKQYEKSGVIIKMDNKYFINKDHKPDFEGSKRYMEDLHKKRTHQEIAKSKGLARPCSANDLITVDEGLQCGNCLALTRDHGKTWELPKNNDDVSKRRSVKVTFNDGDVISTEINGTKKEIEDYYLKHNFVKSDETTMHHGISVEFLD